MNDELENVDPEKLTQAQAGTLFQSKVSLRMGKTGVDLTQAWAATRILNPALYAKMSTHEQEPAVANIQLAGRYGNPTNVVAGAITPANPYVSRNASPPPNLARVLMPRRPVSLPNEENIGALGLPRNCSFDEFARADACNAGMSPRDSRAIFDGLVALLTDRGFSTETALAEACTRYPVLAREVGSDLTGRGLTKPVPA